MNFQPRRKPLSLMQWPRLAWSTAFLEDAVTANWLPADVRRPGDPKISKRNGSGEDVETTSTTATSKSGSSKNKTLIINDYPRLQIRQELYRHQGARDESRRTWRQRPRPPADEPPQQRGRQEGKLPSSEKRNLSALPIFISDRDKMFDVCRISPGRRGFFLY